MKRLFALLLVPGLVLVSEAASAQGKGKGHEKAKGDKKAATIVVVIDRDAHHRAIREYYGREAMPPGLAKRQSLPPGLRKQLRERGALPPGLDRYWVVVPEPLVRRLPPVPPHYYRYFVDDDLVIVDTQRHIVVSIIPGVLVSMQR